MSCSAWCRAGATGEECCRHCNDGYGIWCATSPLHGFLSFAVVQAWAVRPWLQLVGVWALLGQELGPAA